MSRVVEIEVGGKIYMVPGGTDHAAYDKKVRIFFDHETSELVVCQGRYCDALKVPPFVGELDLRGIEFRANVALRGYAYGIGPDTVEGFKIIAFSGGTDLIKAYELLKQFDGKSTPLMLSDAMRRFLKLPDDLFAKEPFVINLILNGVLAYAQNLIEIDQISRENNLQKRYKD